MITKPINKQRKQEKQIYKKLQKKNSNHYYEFFCGKTINRTLQYITTINFLTGTYPEYSEEDYLNAVTANLILNIGLEPVNTPFHQTWKHKHRVLLQTTLDGAALKRFSVLPMDIK